MAIVVLVAGRLLASHPTATKYKFPGTRDVFGDSSPLEVVETMPAGQ